MKPVLILLAILAVIVASLNLLWLGFSSARLVVGHKGVASVVLRVDDEVVDIGNLRKGESRFLFLPKGSGSPGEKAHLTVTFRSGRSEVQACALGIEPTLQHVDVILYDDIESTCSLNTPILSQLIVTKFF